MIWVVTEGLPFAVVPTEGASIILASGPEITLRSRGIHLSSYSDKLSTKTLKGIGFRMKIKAIEISNFRGIQWVRATGINDLVVIAGPNGSGKSCILDAIRLTKSMYGGYQANEWNLWMGEFQINMRSESWELRKLLRRSNLNAGIKLSVEVSARESEYLQEKSDELMEEAAYATLSPGQTPEQWRRIKQEGRVGSLQPEFLSQMERVKEYLKTQLQGELTGLHQEARVTISPNGDLGMGNNITLKTLWRIYEPGRVGIIDYHGSYRIYAREHVAGINLSLQTHDEQQKQRALYNYQDKYTNIKTEMATEYVIDVLRKEGGDVDDRSRRSLVETLKELFWTFFPGKEFEGPKADRHGNIAFPVRVGEAEHDINELSSGEKEILYGYLRLRSTARRDSIILLDEPELHLNPKLIQGLPQFYEKHLVSEIENQMWLVTHSDALLREALITPRATVLHMQEPKDNVGTFDQLKRVEEGKDEELAVLELVGDIAGYKPEGKIVIFEGANAGFDERMTRRLFPEYERRMNFIAGGNKVGVERLHKCLEASDDDVGIKIYSIVDRDKQGANRPGERRYAWNAYHIENYLLESTYIADVMRNIAIDNPRLRDARGVETELLGIAQSHLDILLKEYLNEYVNGVLVRKIQVNATNSDTLGKDLWTQARASAQGVSEALVDELTEEKIEYERSERQQSLQEALQTDNWKFLFRGRDILKVFVAAHCQGLPYERLRDMVVNEMQKRSYQPSGMRDVLRRIDQH